METRSFSRKGTCIVLALSMTTLLVVNFVVLPRANMPAPGETTVTVHGVTIIVDYKNGTVETRQDLSIEGTAPTVFDLLSREFQVSYRIFPNGYFVTSINGAAGGYVFSIDGMSPGVASNKVLLANNSMVTWNRTQSS